MSNRFHADTPEAAARQMVERMAPPGYSFTALFPYFDAEGAFVWGQARADHPSEGKWLRPIRPNGEPRTYTIGGMPKPPAGKPLYRLPQLIAADPAATVYVVEGEKAADALASLGVVATTSGSATSADAADWSPLKRRRVVVWPDFDAPGEQYAREVMARVEGCQLVDTAALNLPSAGDAADWVSAATTADDVYALPRIDSTPSNGPRVQLLCGSTVRPESVDWLWGGFIAAGKFHVLGGAPGTGKTTLAVALASILSRGGRWPDGTKAKRGSVVIWSGEDGVRDTLAPRFIAADADMSMVHFVGDRHEGDEVCPFDPGQDMDLLCDAIGRLPDVRLVILDPVVAAVTGDSHKNNEVRRGLAPLVDLADRHGAAVLGITHFSKGTMGRDPLERITGSIAFGALARLVLVTAKQEEEPDRPARRVLLRAKSNIGPDGGGFVYGLHQVPLDGWPGVVASSVQWEDAIEGSAREILAVTESDGGDRSAIEEAREWLQGELEVGPKGARAVKAEARAAGISERTLERAKGDLRVKTSKTAAGWVWTLPEAGQGRQGRQESQGENVGDVGGLELAEAEETVAVAV